MKAAAYLIAVFISLGSPSFAVVVLMTRLDSRLAIRPTYGMWRSLMFVRSTPVYSQPKVQQHILELKTKLNLYWTGNVTRPRQSYRVYTSVVPVPCRASWTKTVLAVQSCAWRLHPNVHTAVYSYHSMGHTYYGIKFIGPILSPFKFYKSKY